LPYFAPTLLHAVSLLRGCAPRDRAGFGLSGHLEQIRSAQYLISMKVADVLPAAQLGLGGAVGSGVSFGFGSVVQVPEELIGRIIGTARDAA
jgi:hypothetical protein